MVFASKDGISRTNLKGTAWERLCKLDVVVAWMWAYVGALKAMIGAAPKVRKKSENKRGMEQFYKKETAQNERYLLAGYWNIDFKWFLYGTWSLLVRLIIDFRSRWI